jgi:hypothetical protein
MSALAPTMQALFTESLAAVGGRRGRCRCATRGARSRLVCFGPGGQGPMR